MKQIVVNLHGIGDAPEGTEPAERPYWLSLDKLDNLLAEIVGHHDLASVALTFDDGNKSDLLAAERLARMGLKAKFFVLVGRIGKEGYLSQDDLTKLTQLGMTIGLHGRNHLDWRKADDRVLVDETIVARQELSALTRAPIGDVAIPFGAYNRRVIRWLTARGFERIYTSDGPCRNDPQEMIWDRLSLRDDMALDDLGAILSGNRSIARRAKMRISQMIRGRFL